MGEERFSSFITKFQEYTFDCGYNEAALKSALCNSLADGLLSCFQYQPEPQTYGGFLALLLQIDSRYWDVRYEMINRPRAPAQCYSGFNQYQPQKNNFGRFRGNNRHQFGNRRPPNKEHDHSVLLKRNSTKTTLMILTMSL